MQDYTLHAADPKKESVFAHKNPIVRIVKGIGIGAFSGAVVATCVIISYALVISIGIIAFTAFKQNANAWQIAKSAIKSVYVVCISSGSVLGGIAGLLHNNNT